jgi:antitoxin (DNA-binding transcriptional repressor) of toxin-antitoxin stability system
LVKSGEDVVIEERGVPIATISSIHKNKKPMITPPRRDPKFLAKFRFTVKPKKKFDVLEILLEDREKR